jgi:hypothetical protein
MYVWNLEMFILNSTILTTCNKCIALEFYSNILN